MKTYQLQILSRIKHETLGTFCELRTDDGTKKVFWMDIHGAKDGRTYLIPDRKHPERNHEISLQSITEYIKQIFGQKTIAVIMPCHSHYVRRQSNIPADLEIVGNWKTKTWLYLDPDIFGNIGYAPRSGLATPQSLAFHTLKIRNYNNKKEGYFAEIRIPANTLNSYEALVDGASGTGGYELVLHNTQTGEVIKKYAAKKYALNVIGLAHVATGVYTDLTQYGAKITKLMTKHAM